jgi:hypothetical protein
LSYDFSAEAQQGSDPGWREQLIDGYKAYPLWKGCIFTIENHTSKITNHK